MKPEGEQQWGVFLPLSQSPSLTLMRTSILSGQMWLDELLVGHPECFREQFGMLKYAFQLLSRELQLCGTSEKVTFTYLLIRLILSYL